MWLELGKNQHKRTPIFARKVMRATILGTLCNNNYLYVSKSDLVNGVWVYLRVSEVVTSCLLMTVISDVMRGIVRMLTGTVLLL